MGSPGRYLTSDWEGAWEVATDWPATAVITSPWVRPALAAGDPDTVPAMVAPLVAFPPKLPVADWTYTPRKAVAPMWTSAEVVPASICLAMDSAASIGIA